MKAKTYLILRIIFCILAVALCAAAVFVFVYLDWWGMACVIGAAVCAALMLLFKRLQTDEENKDNPPAPVGDFITGPVHCDNANKGEDNDAGDGGQTPQ